METSSSCVTTKKLVIYRKNELLNGEMSLINMRNMKLTAFYNCHQLLCELRMTFSTHGTLLVG